MWLRAAIVLILASTFSFSQEVPPSKASIPVSDQAALSPDLLNRILALIAESGSDDQLSAGTAEALGLTDNGQSWPFRQIGAKNDEYDSSSPLHIFAINRGNDEDLLIYLHKAGVSHFIRARRNGQVVSAISLDAAGERSTVIASTDAQQEVKGELEFWGHNLERTAKWQSCVGELGGAHPVAAEKKLEGCTWLIQSGTEKPAALAVAYTNRSAVRDNPEKQMDDLNEAVKLDPSSEMAWAGLCSAQNWVSKDTQAAMKSCSKVIELNPQSPSGWTYRGDIHLRNKEYDEAIADYDHAIKLDPQWMWPLDNRGEAYLRKGQIIRAIQDFNDVVRVSPDYAMGFLDRGIAEMRANDLQSALDDFQKGIKIDPKCGSCLIGQGLVEVAGGDRVVGRGNIAKGKALSPKAVESFEIDGIKVP